MIKKKSCSIEIGGVQCWDTIKRANKVMEVDKYLPIKSSKEIIYSKKL
jgi:hypothetical protein